eukprot:5853894-Lingulodinium_polyedra.AAC.1
MFCWRNGLKTARWRTTRARQTWPAHGMRLRAGAAGARNVLVVVLVAVAVLAVVMMYVLVALILIGV